MIIKYNVCVHMTNCATLESQEIKCSVCCMLTKISTGQKFDRSSWFLLTPTTDWRNGCRQRERERERELEMDRNRCTRNAHSQ